MMEIVKARAGVVTTSSSYAQLDLYEKFDYLKPADRSWRRRLRRRLHAEFVALCVHTCICAHS